MQKLARWLMVVPFVVVAAVACSDATTGPKLTAPEAKRTVGFYCTEDTPDCIDQQMIDLDTYPEYEIVNLDTLDATYGMTPLGSAAWSATDPVCTYTVSKTLNGADFDLPASCADGPCYTQYLDARTAYRQAMAAGVVGGIGSLITYLTPGGKVIRVIKTSGAIVGTVGFVGWANRSMVQAANAKLKACIGQNIGFYHYTIIY